MIMNVIVGFYFYLLSYLLSFILDDFIFILCTLARLGFVFLVFSSFALIREQFFLYAT
jgi:hypothetical protein